MKRLLPVLLSAYLIIGQNHNLMLGNGASVGLNIEQPLDAKTSLCPFGSFDRNDGFHDQGGGMDITFAATPLLTFIMGAGYEKYTLIGAPPTETSNVHTSVRIKIW